jgi:hypothetical protein
MLEGGQATRVLTGRRGFRFRLADLSWQEWIVDQKLPQEHDAAGLRQPALTTILT